MEKLSRGVWRVGRHVFEGPRGKSRAREFERVSKLPKIKYSTVSKLEKEVLDLSYMVRQGITRKEQHKVLRRVRKLVKKL